MSLIDKDKSKAVFKAFQDVIFEHQLTTVEVMMIVDELKTCLLMDRIMQSKSFMNVDK